MQKIASFLFFSVFATQALAFPNFVNLLSTGCVAGANPLQAANCDIDAVEGASVGDLLLQKHVLGYAELNPEQFSNCDLINDKTLSIRDVILLQKLIGL